MKDCCEITELLSEYIDEELDEATSREVDTHLRFCEKCVIEYRHLKEMIKACNELDEVELPEGFGEKLHVKLLEAQKLSELLAAEKAEAGRKKLFTAFNIKVLSSVAAAIVLVVALKGFMDNYSLVITPKYNGSQMLTESYTADANVLYTDDASGKNAAMRSVKAHANRDTGENKGSAAETTAATALQQNESLAGSADIAKEDAYGSSQLKASIDAAEPRAAASTSRKVETADMFLGKAYAGEISFSAVITLSSGRSEETIGKINEAINVFDAGQPSDYKVLTDEGVDQDSRDYIKFSVRSERFNDLLNHLREKLMFSSQDMVVDTVDDGYQALSGEIAEINDEIVNLTKTKKETEDQEQKNEIDEMLDELLIRRDSIQDEMNRIIDLRGISTITLFFSAE